MEFVFEVHGISAHAAVKSRGINAIEKTVELFDLLQKDLSKFDTTYAINSLNLAYLNGGNLDDKGVVTYSGNVVPNYAKCVGEIRFTDPKISKEYVEKRIREIGKRLNVEISEIYFKFLMGSMYTHKEEIREFEKAITESGIKCEYASINDTGYFEVQLLQEKWNGSVTVFGPGPALNAHCVDEYVEIDTINKTFNIIETFIKKALNKF